MGIYAIMVLSKKERGNNMIKYVGTHVTLDNVELEKLLKEGYSHITKHGYAISDDEDISTNDIIIKDALCCLYEILI